MKYYHHGDVILIPVKEIKGKKIEGNRNYNVLALGEVTGHAHVIEKENSSLFKNDEDVLFLDVTLPTFLKHLNINTFSELPQNEHPHAPIEILPGKYKVCIVKQYDPWEKEIKNVRD